MERIDHHAVACILATTSTSRLAGLLCADQDYKARAAHAVAREIVDRLQAPERPDRNQLALPL